MSPRRSKGLLGLAALGCGALAACSAGPKAAPAAEGPAASPGPGDPLAADRLMRDVEWLVDPDRAGRGSFQPGSLAAARYIARAFTDAGLEVHNQEVPGGAINVVGLRRAGPEAVLISAHYDHLGIDPAGLVYPGADDNASGTAVLLGLVRATASKDYQRTLVFIATGAEEAGLIGMGAYIREPLWPLEQTRVVVNFDMVGRNFFEWGSGKPATAAVVGLEADPVIARAAHRAAERAGLELVAAPADMVELFGFQDRTDEWWFRRRDVPALHFSTSLHPDYHQPTDTVDKLVPAQLERIAKTAYYLLDFLGRVRKEL